MHWREAEREYNDTVLGRETLPVMFQKSATRHSTHAAQAYKGGVYDRSLTPDILDEAPAGSYQTITYEQMHQYIRSLAAGFRELGVNSPNRVGIFANTRLEWALSDFALLASGAVITTIYPSSTPRRVEYLLDNSDAIGVVVENESLLASVLEIEDSLDLSFIVSIDSLPAEQTTRDDIYTLRDVHDLGEEAGTANYQTWIENQSPSDLASLIYTSGTTGQPKGVQLTHWNFKSNVDQVRRRFGPRPDKNDLPVVDHRTTTLSFLPLAHVFERLGGHFFMFSSGACVAYAESPDTLRDDFQHVQPTTSTSVPRVYERVFSTAQSQAMDSAVKSKIFDWAVAVAQAYSTTTNPSITLRGKRALADRVVFKKIRDGLGGNLDFLISGGGKLSPELCAFFNGAGIPVLEGYGLTETSPVVSANPLEDIHIGTIGPSVIDVEIKLDASIPGIDDTAIEFDGDVGELLIQGPNVTSGYWQDEAATTDAFTPDGWFRTGDIVGIDTSEYLTFIERKKELLVLSTGKIVAPTPIEDAFTESNLVNQIIILGDERKLISALIVPEFSVLRERASSNGISIGPTIEEACNDDRVHAWYQEEIDRINQNFEPHETIKQFRLVPEEFTIENGLLTPTLKKKRRNITDKYADQITAIYS